MATAAIVFGAKVAGAIAISYLLRPKPQDTEGPRLQDGQYQDSAYGYPIRKTYGTDRIAGNVIWADRIIEHKSKKKVGGKGGGRPTHTEYSYTRSMAIGLCEGEISGLRRIWANGRPIYDVRDETGGTGWNQNLTEKEGLFWESMTVYPGSETQLPDATIEAVQGTGNVPAYRGLAYVVFENFNISEFGNIVNFTFEIGAGTDTNVAYVTNADLETSLVFGSGISPNSMMINDGQIAILRYGSSTPTRHVGHFNYYTGEQIGSKDYDIVDLVYGGTDNNEADYTAFFGIIDGQWMLCKVCSKTESDPSPIRIHLKWASLDHTVIGSTLPDDSTDPTYALSGANPGAGFSPGSYFSYGYSLAHNREILAMYRQQTGGVSASRIYVYDWSTVIKKDTTEHALIATYDVGVDLSCISVAYDKIIGIGDNSTDIYEYKFSNLPDHDLTVTTGVAVGPGVGIESSCVCQADNGDIIVSASNCFAAQYGETTNEGLFTLDRDTLVKKSITSYTDTTADPVYVADIVDDIMAMAGLDASEYDNSNLTDTVIGYTIGSPMEAKAAIEPLSRAYIFDVSEIDWGLVSISRGGSISGDLDADQAINIGTDDNPVAVKTAKAQLHEIPREITLNYRDQATDYQVGTAIAQLTSDNSSNKKALSYDIVLTASQATQICEKLLQASVAGRTTYTARIAGAADIAPSDIVTINGSGRAVVESVSMVGINTYEITAISELQSSYESTTVVDDPYHAPNEALPQYSTTRKLILDIPMPDYPLTDTGIFVAAFNPIGETYNPVDVYASYDGGVEYYHKTAITNPVIYGYTTTTVASGPTTVVDEGTTIDVKITSNGGALSSTTLLSAMANTNTAAIGRNGNWEIISFVDVVDNGDDEYTLSTLIRGRLGTDANVGNLDNSGMRAQFVLLDEDTIKYVGIPADNFDSFIKYKFLPYGYPVNHFISTVSHQSDGASIAPYSPVFVIGSRDAGDLDIEWTRRTRYDPGWTYGATPVIENSESYEIDIYNAGWTTVLRTITASTGSATYTSAQQTTDFGAPQSSINMIVYQLSDILGRGTGRSATL